MSDAAPTQTKARTVKTPGGAPAESTPAAAPAAAVESGDLPNAVDINPKALRGPVLTRQGYVCPDEAWQKSNPAEFQALLKG